MGINARVIVHDEIVREKLLLAAPRILATNRLLVEAMLNEVKLAEVSQTPEGPGHFGYHGRDTVRVQITTKGAETMGRLVGAVQLFWREYGTRGRFRNKRNKLRSYVAAIGGAGGGGERAYMVANRALSFTKRFIKAYYGGTANWWNS